MGFLYQYSIVSYHSALIRNPCFFIYLFLCMEVFSVLVFSNYLDSLPAKYKKWKLDNFKIQNNNNNNDNSQKTRKKCYFIFLIFCYI